MMRNDGAFTVYLIQHSYPDYRDGAFVESDLGNFLFRGLSFEDRKGATADHYRALIHPVHDCWQRVGVNGFLNLPEAKAAYETLKLVIAEREGRSAPAFRLVRRTIVQRTAVVA